MRRALAGLVLCCACPLLADALRPGPQVVTFHSDVDNSDQPYALYVPNEYDPQQRYPLIIMLHAEGADHRVALRQVFGVPRLPGETNADVGRRWPVLRPVPAIVLAPMARGSMDYQGIAERDVYDAIADVKRRLSVDEDRVYLTGSGMGGGGALRLALTRPDVWAAVALVCPENTEPLVDLARNAQALPVHLFHGSADPLVPVKTSRDWQKRLQDVGARVRYVEYPQVRHNAADFAYAGDSLMQWFFQFRRERAPARVQLVAQQLKYGSAYWVRIDRMPPGGAAKVDAAFTGRNQLRISTEQTGAISLRLAGHPQVDRSRWLRLQVNNAVLRARATEWLSLAENQGRWSVVARPALVGKRAGLEGPLAEAAAGRQIYVYGTKDAPAADEVLRRRNTATAGAEWSTARHPLRLDLPVLADVQVKEASVSDGALVLFGNKETNEVLARASPLLPMELSVSAADYGLVFVYPWQGRYVLVNSGLPYWTGSEERIAKADPLLPRPYRVLTTLPDFVLFRGSLANVVVQGRFDEHWRLPADAAAKLRETGAVFVK